MNKEQSSPKKYQNKTILVRSPNSDQILLVIALLLDPSDMDVERLLAALVPEMAKGQVRGGLMVVGDSTLVLRLVGEEMLVDEVDTTELLGLADIDEPWSRDDLVDKMLWWIGIMSNNWRDRVVGSLKELLVPNLVAGLRGETQVVEGIWGLKSQRLATELK